MGSYGGRGPLVNAVLWIETVVAAIIVIMRIYTRKVILRSPGIDDLMVVLALFTMAAYAAFISAATSHGLGRAYAELDPREYTQATKMEIIGQAICILNIPISKSAVAFFLLRILGSGWHRIFIWFCIVTTSIISVFCAIAVFVQCTPVESVWDHSVQGVCTLDFASIGIATSAWAVVMDFVLAFFPCLVVWNLNMKQKDRIVVVSGLSLGVFAGVCGILRTINLTSLNQTQEYILATVNMLIYSGTENFVTIVCASVPVLRPLYINLFGEGRLTDEAKGSSYVLKKYADSRDFDRAPGIIRSQTKIGTGRGNVPYSTEEDNQSEESILRDVKVQNKYGGSSGITQTHEVSVSYSTTGSNLTTKAYASDFP